MRKKELKYWLKRLLWPLTGCFLFLIFGHILSNGFVWLDFNYIVDNPFAHTFKLSEVFQGSYLVGENFYRPLISLYYVVMYSLFKDQAFFYHLLQLTIYLANGYLLYLLLKHHFPKATAYLVALLFLVHPINHVNATFISQSADTWYMFFGLLAFVVYLKFKSNRKMFWVFFLLLLSLMFKETGILFLFALILYSGIVDKKITSKNLAFSAATLTIYLLIRLVNGGFNFMPSNAYAISNLSLGQRLGHLPLIQATYLRSLFLFHNIGLAQIWTISNINFDSFFKPLLVDLGFLSLLIGFAIYLHHQKSKYFRLYIFFLTLLALGITFHSQILPLDYTIARRWLYFPLIGLLGILAIIIEFVARTNRLRIFISCLLVVVIVISAVTTRGRIVLWKDNLTLFSYYTKINDNYILETQLGEAYLRNNDLNNARIHFAKSVSMLPYDENLALLGIVTYKLDKTPEARKILLDAYASPSHLPPKKHPDYVYRELAKFFIVTKDYPTAKLIATQSVIDYPNDDYFWALLAADDYALGHQTEAESNITHAVYLSPNTLNKTLYHIIWHKLPLTLNF